MNLKTKYNNILSIIPESKHKKLFRFLGKSVLFGIVDLVSIGYLIPIIILLFDQKKFEEVSTKIPFLQQILNSISIPAFVLIFVVFYFFKIIIQTKFNTVFYLFFYDLSTDLSIRNTDSFINESFIKHQNINKGKVLQNVTNVPEDFSIRYLISIINLISELVVLSLLLSVLLFLYFKITLVSMLLLSVFAIFIYFTKQKQMTIINSVYLKTQAKSNASLLNLLDGYLEIKNSGNYAFFLEKFREEKALLNSVTGKLVSYNSNYAKYLEIVLIVSIIGFALFNLGNKNIIITISVLGASSLRLIPSISRILNALTLLKSYQYSVDVLSKKQKSSITNIIQNNFLETIKLDKIDFRYDENIILENLNITIPKASFIGITGESGIGKTTLLYIILGIIKPEKGSFLIDGKMTTNFDFLSFANYVPQQPFLFKGTIIENIVMGQNPNEIDFEYLEYLCQKLELSAVINKMKNQFNSEIVHDSLRLSGGQKQRLALVRALYTKPSLLILDEATNQQDVVLANKIYTFLTELKKDSKLTIVAISHHNELNSYADFIYELKDKNLVQK